MAHLLNMDNVFDTDPDESDEQAGRGSGSETDDVCRFNESSLRGKLISTLTTCIHRLFASLIAGEH
jgi:hypothetical protein